MDDFNEKAHIWSGQAAALIGCSPGVLANKMKAKGKGSIKINNRAYYLIDDVRDLIYSGKARTITQLKSAMMLCLKHASSNFWIEGFWHLVAKRVSHVSIRDVGCAGVLKKHKEELREFNAGKEAARRWWQGEAAPLAEYPQVEESFIKRVRRGEE